MIAYPLIPSELSDRIIDHLHNDPYSLKTCSLVSREWLPTARYHLFSDVYLQSQETVHALQRNALASATLARSIRGLTISDRDRFLTSTITQSGALGGALPNVESLRIFMHTLVQPAVIDFLEKNWLSVRHLELQNVVVRSLRDVQDSILTPRPNIKTVTLRQVSLHPNAPANAVIPLRLPSLERLSVDSHALRIPLDFSPGDGTAEIGPRSLEIVSVYDNDIVRVAQLTNAVGPDLESFQLRASGPITTLGIRRIPEEFALFGNNPSLKSITLIDISPFLHNLAPILLALLSEVVSKVVEEISIDLTIRPVRLRTDPFNVQNESPQQKWEQATQFFSDARFPALKRFKVLCRMPPQASKEEKKAHSEKMRSWLSALDKRGVLSVTFR